MRPLQLIGCLYALPLLLLVYKMKDMTFITLEFVPACSPPANWGNIGIGAPSLTDVRQAGKTLAGLTAQPTGHSEPKREAITSEQKIATFGGKLICIVSAADF